MGLNDVTADEILYAIEGHKGIGYGMSSDEDIGLYINVYQQSEFPQNQLNWSPC